METELSKKIKNQIRDNGPITFRDFMDLALYDPVHGFYTKGPGIGSSTGTFNTNAMFPAFAFALARAIQQVERGLKEPLRILELGGGSGELASHLRSFLPTPHEYVIADVSPSFRAQQTRRGFQVVESVDHLTPAPTFAFGNEVLDAFPVHRVMGTGGNEILEFFVGIDGNGELNEEPHLPSTPLLADRLRSEGTILGRGQIAEICLEIEGFIEKLSLVISKGYLIFIDYGMEASRLYAPSNRNGTLRSFRSQQAVFNALEWVGNQDLTADVDFTALKKAALKVGFHPMGIFEQGTWLKNLSIQGYRELIKDSQVADQEIFFLTNPARLGSTFDVSLFKTKGLPDGPGLHLG